MYSQPGASFFCFFFLILCFLMCISHYEPFERKKLEGKQNACHQPDNTFDFRTFLNLSLLCLTTLNPLGTYHFFLPSCPDRQGPFSYAHAVASLFPSCSQDFA